MSDWAITYSKDEATERQVLPFPTSRAPKRSPSTCWNGPRPTSSRATSSTGKLESDEPAELLLRRFGIVVTGIAEA
ncbi:hypothetical protein P4056_27475 [Pseudomonas aeruginosa]|nr:hypothetical protein [Pseudomonas aeruginosa]